MNLMMKGHRTRIIKTTFRVYLFLKNTTNNSINHWFFPLTKSDKKVSHFPKKKSKSGLTQKFNDESNKNRNQ